MNKVHILVGHIASGKSTYCKNAAKNGKIIINDDDIINLLHADDYTLYDKKLKILYKNIENQILGLVLAMHLNVVVDRGLNVSAKARQRWIALVKSFDVPCEAICFNKETPEVHAKRRTDHDARGHTYDYWLDVANHHENIYCEPTLKEGFDKVHYINFKDIEQKKVFD